MALNAPGGLVSIKKVHVGGIVKEKRKTELKCQMGMSPFSQNSPLALLLFSIHTQLTCSSTTLHSNGD